MRDGAAIYRQAFLSGLKPDEKLTVSEWSDQYRMLSNKASAEPGPWRTDRTPYLREIMDCMSSTSSVQKVVFMAGAQLGKTECINNVVGYMIAHAPGPALFVQPTIEMAKGCRSSVWILLFMRLLCCQKRWLLHAVVTQGTPCFQKALTAGSYC